MNKCSPLRSLNPSVAQLSALLSRSPETVISPVVFRCFHVIEPPRNGGIHGRKAVPNFVALYWWNTRARERSEGGGGLRVERINRTGSHVRACILSLALLFASCRFRFLYFHTSGYLRNGRHQTAC